MLQLDRETLNDLAYKALLIRPAQSGKRPGVIVAILNADRPCGRLPACLRLDLSM